MRTILSVASLVMFVGVTIFLLSKEDIVPPEVTASHVALQVDPLLDTRYTSGARKRNLESFGLPDAMVARTIDRMRRIEDRHTRKISCFWTALPIPMRSRWRCVGRPARFVHGTALCDS